VTELEKSSRIGTSSIFPTYCTPLAHELVRPMRTTLVGLAREVRGRATRGGPGPPEALGDRAQTSPHQPGNLPDLRKPQRTAAESATGSDPGDGEDLEFTTGEPTAP